MCICELFKTISISIFNYLLAFTTFKLDYSNMCDGSITEDSDTWLFGGKRIYKNFFGSEPCIDVYTIDIIKNLLGTSRILP